MWHLNSLSEETLKWYKEIFLDSIADSLIDAKLNDDVLEVIMPKGGKAVLEKLLTAQPQELYPLNLELEKEIKEKDVADDSKDKIFNANVQTMKEVGGEDEDYIGMISAGSTGAVLMSSFRFLSSDGKTRP